MSGTDQMATSATDLPWSSTPLPFSFDNTSCEDLVTKYGFTYAAARRLNRDRLWPWLDVSNPDIEGIGVLVGFFMTAYLSILVMCVYYFTGCHRMGDNSMAPLDESILVLLRNPILKLRAFILEIQIECSSSNKQSLRDRRSRLLSRMTLPIASREWRRNFETLLLNFSDQQMVTGIAVMAAGYSQLDRGISIYHWRMLTYMVWCSSITHLATLTILRSHFRRKPRHLKIRFFFIISLGCLILGALVPTIEYTDRYLPNQFPAKCLYRKFPFDNASEPDIGAIISIGLLAFGYTTRIIGLFDTPKIAIAIFFRNKPKGLLIRLLKRLNPSASKNPRLFTGFFRWGIYHFLASIFVWGSLICKILESLVWELLWLFLSVIWVTSNFLYFRNAEEERTGQRAEANEWSFGQLLAPLIVLLPFLTIWTAWEDDQKKSEQNNDTQKITRESELDIEMQASTSSLENIDSIQKVPNATDDSILKVSSPKKVAHITRITAVAPDNDQAYTYTLNHPRTEYIDDHPPPIYTLGSERPNPYNWIIETPLYSYRWFRLFVGLGLTTFFCTGLLIYVQLTSPQTRSYNMGEWYLMYYLLPMLHMNIFPWGVIILPGIMVMIGIIQYQIAQTRNSFITSEGDQQKRPYLSVMLKLFVPLSAVYTVAWCIVAFSGASINHPMFYWYNQY